MRCLYDSSVVLSISLELDDEKFMIQPLAWAKTFLRLTDGDTLNLLLNSWTILAVAVDEENVGIRFIFQLAYHATITAKLIEKHLTAFGLLVYQSGSPIWFYFPIFLSLLARYDFIEPLLADGEGQYFLFHPYTSSQSVARIHSVGIAATPKENILDTHVLYDIV